MRTFKIVNEEWEKVGINMPTRSTKLSAGYDLSSAIDAVIEPHQYLSLPTGLKAIMEDDDFLLLVPRSSLAKKHGVRLFNTVGIIDADYANNPTNGGHIHIVLYNFTNVPQTIIKGERIVQAIFLKYQKTDDDSSINEREGGFGSTGSK